MKDRMTQATKTQADLDRLTAELLLAIGEEPVPPRILELAAELNRALALRAAVTHTE